MWVVWSHHHLGWELQGASLAGKVHRRECSRGLTVVWGSSRRGPLITQIKLKQLRSQRHRRSQTGPHRQLGLSQRLLTHGLRSSRGLTTTQLLADAHRKRTGDLQHSWPKGQVFWALTQVARRIPMLSLWRESRHVTFSTRISNLWMLVTWRRSRHLSLRSWGRGNHHQDRLSNR